MVYVLSVFFIILGWASGAWVNYLADVLPSQRRLVPPFCLSCQQRMSWFNYLLTPRRCLSCGRRRHWRAWVVEGVFVGLTVWLWRSPPQSLHFLLGWLVLMYFGVVVVIDLEHRLILHPVSWVGAVLGLVVGTWTRADYYASSHLPTGGLMLGYGADAWLNGFINALLGGVVGFGIMWLLYTFGEWLLRVLARRRGLPSDEVALGFGDVNLSGVVGLMLGWPVVVLGLFTAVLIGGLVSLLYLLVMLAIRRYHILTALPYGPYLVAGAVLVLYFPRILADILK